MRCLVIDDKKEWLEEVRKLVGDIVVTVECHNVKDAVKAINAHEPDVIFLDHHLTPNGGEGVEIANYLKGKKIYSTTNMAGGLPFDISIDYLLTGISEIEWIGKSSQKIKSIIES